MSAKIKDLKMKLSLNKKFCNAFTLAEVLITLGIIGVVAAMTIPVLMVEYKKSVIETRLKKVYSTVNQAINLSMLDNGDKKTWDTLTSSNVDTWYNKYLAPYLKTAKVNSGSNFVQAYFSDGSLLQIASASWTFYPRANDLNNPAYVYGPGTGRANFTFYFDPTTNNTSNAYHYNKGFEPYKSGWDGNENTLLTNTALGCKQTVTNIRAYCTALIQLHNWKIPDNYPLNF